MIDGVTIVFYMHEGNFLAVLMLFCNCYPTIPLKYPVVVDHHYPRVRLMAKWV